MGELVPSVYVELEQVLVKRRQDGKAVLSMSEITEMTAAMGIVNQKEVCEGIEGLEGMRVESVRM